MTVDKTFNAIRDKYYWPKLYKEFLYYVTACVVCESRSLKKVRPSMGQTDISPYSFARIGIGLSGPYPTTLAGIKYILTFIELYSGWSEAFFPPSKTAVIFR